MHLSSSLSLAVEMLNPWVLRLARAWAPRIMLPFSMFIGYLGKNIDVAFVGGIDWMLKVRFAQKLVTFLFEH